MRIPFIAGNWKMNMTVAEASEFADELLNNNLMEGVEAAICAPFIDLPVLVEKFKDTNLKIGAQNVYFKESGAFTGEISAPMLKDLSIDYVIVGHSERRELFGESDSEVNKKVHAVVEAEMVPIICVGETETERDLGEHEMKVAQQVKAALEGIKEDAANNLVIAYEPIWAIGSGKSATSDDANKMCHSIRNEVKKLYSHETAERMRILYGGSVKPGTIKDLMAKSDVDGALVGGASLKTEDYMALVTGAAR